MGLSGIFGWAVVVTLVVSCDRNDPSANKPKSSSREVAPQEAQPSQAKPTEARRSLLELASSCSLGQRGLVLDVGDPATEARRLFRLTRQQAPVFTTRLGESFRRLDQMNTDFIIWTTEKMSDFELSARVHGLTSERMAAYIDGHRLGSTRLKPNETSVVAISGSSLVIEPGQHKLTLSLSRPRSSEPAAEVSWVRLGPHQESSSTDFPATRKEVFSEVTIGDERLRSVVLRPGASIRCPVWVPPETSFSAEAGVWGEGPGEVEMIVHTRKRERVVVASAERKEDDPRDFELLSADLARFEGQFVDLELAAPRALRRARMVLGNPVLKSANVEEKKAPLARRAIVFVLSGLGEKHAPPAAAENGLPVFNLLAQQGASYPGYRTSTTSAAGVMASLLTGLPPWLHHVSAADTGLSRDLVTLASTVEGQGGISGFFTGVPLSFSPLGFERGFGRFESVAPQEDRAAVEPLDLAKNWLKDHLAHADPVLAVVHLRGGHPPFDVSKDAALELPPAEYGGNLSARRAAIQLAEVRARQSRRNRHIPDEDWIRLRALQKAALLRQDAALTHFFTWLQERGAYDDTMIVLMGDVGAGEVPDVPFSDRAPLDEPYLSPPLVIKYPKGYLGGTDIAGPFAPRDLTETIVRSLGITWETQRDAIDLGSSAASRKVHLRPHIAYRDGTYSMRQGELLLRGEDGDAPELCLPALDPSCLVNRSNEHVLQSRALWFELFTELSGPLSTPHEETPVAEVARHQDALLVWGVKP